MDELGGVWMGQVQGCAELGGIVGDELANLPEAPRKQRCGIHFEIERI